MKFENLITKGWADYELLDSGDGEKLERFGSIILARPETQALWAKKNPALWSEAHAVFTFADKKGTWNVSKVKPLESASRFNLADGWELSRGPLKFLARLTSFKHTGIFPEQEPNWDWIRARISDTPCPKSDLGHGVSDFPKVLNLFGYTGIASLVAAEAGAQVTHVDASKQSLDWASENAKLSGIPPDKIRWMLDDALAFAKREVRRGVKYDGIILDPPAFGRGAKGEVWHIEEDLPGLLATLKELLSDAPGSFFLINGYAAGYAPLSFAQAIESTFGTIEGEYGELHIQESQGDRAIPAGIYVRFMR